MASRALNNEVEMSAKTWVLLVSFLLLGAVGVLFYVQNSSREIALSLDLGFAAFKTREALPAPALLLGSFGGGLVLGAALVALRRRGGESMGGLGRPGGSAGDPWS